MIKEALSVTYHASDPILGHPSQLVSSSFELVSSTKEAAVCELYLAPHFLLFLFPLFLHFLFLLWVQLSSLPTDVSSPVIYRCVHNSTAST